MSAVRPDRENIPAPPVVLVTGEARFTDSPRLRQQDTLDAIAIALEARFPISESISGTSLEESGSGAPPRLVPRRALVLRNTASTEAITLTSSSVAIERWGRLVGRWPRTLQPHSPGSGCAISMRFEFPNR